jgi:hypothetical protein
LGARRARRAGIALRALGRFPTGRQGHRNARYQRQSINPHVIPHRPASERPQGGSGSGAVAAMAGSLRSPSASIYPVVHIAWGFSQGRGSSAAPRIAPGRRLPGSSIGYPLPRLRWIRFQANDQATINAEPDERIFQGHDRGHPEQAKRCA